MPTVLKLGGAVVDDADTLDAIEKTWKERQDVNESWSLVHGGGPQLDQALQAVQGPAVKISGLRVTSPEGAQAVQKTLDIVGAHLAATLRQRGLPAIHIPATSRLLKAAVKRVPDGDLGRVGTPMGFDVATYADLVPPGTLAIVTPVGWDSMGPLNVNADEAACSLAGALQAARLVLATDVSHVLDDQGDAIMALNAESAQSLIDRGIAQGGMVPKLQSAMMALDHGAKEVVIGSLRNATAGGGTKVRLEVAA